ncbi:hypothetical protein Y1Q_0018976 [Alligator mississippiensis]|uniref:Uncharacterized protein n=1 Tax=Alligator mississippiensis TaxID=8496 RepID=A0A151M3G3_ALLMI|nr:hypothetical protein Y1Q_0018976 [Alligator mississippiensis]
MVAKEWQVDSWDQYLEDMAHEWEKDTQEQEREACKVVSDAHEVARDWESQVFRDRLLALEKNLEAQEWQVCMVARAVEDMEEGHWVLDTILTLVVTLMLPAALTLAPTPHAPWQPPQQQAPLLGPGLRCSSVSTSQMSLPWLPPWDPCHPGPLPSSSPAAQPGSMWPQSKSCLQWGQDHVWILLAWPTGHRRGSSLHQQSSA